MSSNKKVVIIGNGIAGITAARHIRKQSDHEILVISSETPHFFARTALMYIFMGQLKFEDTKPYEDFFWKKNRIDIFQGFVNRVNSVEKRVHLSNGKDIHYDSLLIASGSTFNRLNWPGQELSGVNGLVSIQDLNYLETWTKNAGRSVIVGGGLIGIELAEMLLSRRIHVTFLVREKNFLDIVLPEEESKMLNRHIREHHIDLRLETELKEFIGDETGRVRAAVTTGGEEIPCQFAALTIGVHPNIGFLNGSGIETAKGILVDKCLRTNIPDIYAAGDCAELRSPPTGRKAIEAMWYTSGTMGETAASNICGTSREYDPGIWFNSAKFLDIEYSVYGEIPSRLPAETGTLYWEHPDGRKSIRINFQKSDRQVTGFNLMGIRYRHEICESWISEKRTLEYVLQNLRKANFDPEFNRKYEKDVAELHDKQLQK